MLAAKEVRPGMRVAAVGDRRPSPVLFVKQWGELDAPSYPALWWVRVTVETGGGMHETVYAPDSLVDVVAEVPCGACGRLVPVGCERVARVKGDVSRLAGPPFDLCAVCAGRPDPSWVLQDN